MWLAECKKLLLSEEPGAVFLCIPGSGEQVWDRAMFRDVCEDPSVINNNKNNNNLKTKYGR